MDQEKEVFKQVNEGHIGDENQFVDSLRRLWLPHQKRDPEVRYQLGVLLNNKLGTPTVRQSYGLQTIKRVAEELKIDKSDISRMRRFAAKYESFDVFIEQEPEATCWSHVRALITINNTADRPTDSRTSWAVQRSLTSLIKTLKSDHDFTGSKADEIRQSLRELIHLATAKFGLDEV